MTINQVVTGLRNSSSSLVRRLSLRQILTAFVLGIVLLSSTYNDIQTVVQPLPPAAATSFQVGDVSHSQLAQADDNSKDAVESQQKVKGAANNVREKLNLDQPLYPPTKEFLDSTQKSPQQALEKTQDVIKDASNSGKGNRSM